MKVNVLHSVKMENIKSCSALKHHKQSGIWLKLSEKKWHQHFLRRIQNKLKCIQFTRWQELKKKKIHK